MPINILALSPPLAVRNLARLQGAISAARDRIVRCTNRGNAATDG
jgi:hypothetical protein